MNLLKKVITAQVILLASLYMPPLMAEGEDSNKKYVLNFPDSDIRDLIETVKGISGKTFIIDPRVKGKVQIISDGSEYTSTEVYQIFQDVLSLNNFGLTERPDGYTMIVPTNSLRNISATFDKDGMIDGNEFITAVIPIKNANVNDIIQILRPVISKYGHIAGEKVTNSLVIVDHASNIKRFRTLVNQFDVVGDGKIEIVELKNAWVGSIVPLLEKINPQTVTSTQGGAVVNNSRTVRLIADERSNRIILKGEDQARAELKKIIRQLDIKTETNSTSKVIFLNNTSAKSMAEMLKGFIGVVQDTQDNSQGAAAPPKNPTAIIADEELDALVIRAEPSLMLEIENTIEQLDIPRDQVLVEAAIVEIEGSVSSVLDVSWVTNPEAVSNGTLPPMISSFGKSGNVLSAGVVGGGASALAAAGSDFSGFGFGIVDPFADVPNFGLIVNALDGKANTKILATPTITLLSNTEGNLVVGQNVPFLTGSTSSDSGSSSNIERNNVGTTLKVKPHIQRNGIVRLEVDQSSDSISSTAIDAADLITNTRTIQTEVLIKSGQTLVLGGLINNNVIERVQKVPVLGSIPILGALFRSKTKEMRKSNLIVIIRPTILHGNTDEASQATQDKYFKVWDVNLGGFKKPDNLPSYDAIFNGEFED